MVAKRQCSFCAQEIEPGTGTIFVKRDGTVYQFCSSSCRKQQLHLGRIGHRFRWTRAYELKRSTERSAAARGASAPPSAPPGPARPEAEAPTTAGEPVGAAAEVPAPPVAEPPAESAPSPPAKKPRAKGGTKPAARTGAGAKAASKAAPATEDEA